MTGMAIGSIVGMAINTITGGLSEYFSADDMNAQADALRSQAQLTAAQQRLEASRQAEVARMQAVASSTAANAQAELARKQTEIAQKSGEYEAQKRMRILASDIGSVYADYAGNGLLVDGGGNDTFGAILKTTRDTAYDDVAHINENAHNAAWTAAESEKILRQNAQVALENGKLSADSARDFGEFRAANTYATGFAQASLLDEQASAARRGGIGTIVTGTQLGGAAARKFGLGATLGIWGGPIFGPIAGGAGHGIDKSV